LAPPASPRGHIQYKIVEQLAHWEYHACAALRRGRDWREQQQRRYYRVRTEEGEVFELYVDWSPARRRRKGGAQGARWYLHRRLRSAAARETPETEGEPEPASRGGRHSTPP